jgi:hypothetical protein
MSNDAQNPGSGPSLEGSPTARAIQQKSGSKDPKDVLAKHQARLGADHPDCKNLGEAIVRKEPEQIKQAMDKLEGGENNDGTEAAAPAEPRARFPLWSFVWIVLVSSGLFGITAWYFSRHLGEILAKQPKPPTCLYCGSELLGGKTSQEFANDIVLGMYNIKPEGVIFVGHQLAKKEVVEYLSAISATTQVKVLIGTDATGYNPLDNPESFLKQYLNKAELREAKYPIRSQVLIAVNTTTRRGMALVGTYPYDVNDASKGEHLTVWIRNYDDCVQMYNAFNKLFHDK